MAAVSRLDPICCGLISRAPQIPSHHLSWLKSLPADAPIEDIRAAYKRDGVVHIRGLLPREQVLGVRKTFFEFVQHTGILKEGTDPVEGIYSGLVSAPD